MLFFYNQKFFFIYFKKYKLDFLNCSDALCGLYVQRTTKKLHIALLVWFIDKSE